jgi:hypothetical protein
VLLGVFLSCLSGVVRSMLMVAVRRVRMVSGLFMFAGFVMLRRFLVMAGGLLVVFGSFAMVLCGLSSRLRKN